MSQATILLPLQFFFQRDKGPVINNGNGGGGATKWEHFGVRKFLHPPSIQGKTLCAPPPF